MAREWSPAGIALGTALVVGAVAAAEGGYDPPAWGWAALALFWAAATVLVLRDRIVLERLDLAMLAAVAALVTWKLASALWTLSVPRTILDVQRDLVYVAALACVLLVLNRRSYRTVLGGVWLAVLLVASYGLARHLSTGGEIRLDPIAGRRLSEPLGYWNALGIFTAIGVVLALGLAARARNLAIRVAAAASPTILLPTLYLTFSRGAWVALALGLAATLAFDPRRLQALTTAVAVAPWPALVVWKASGLRGLTRIDANLATTRADGRELAGWLAAALVGAVLSALLLAVLEARIRPGRRVRQSFGAVVLAALALGALAAMARYGSPPTLVDKAYTSFKRPAPVATDLNKRLQSLSSPARYRQWQVAWDEAREHPWLGSGAGTYEPYWLRHRPAPSKIKDAHNLYIETLAELGPLGLALLGVALAVPLAAAAVARRGGLVPAALGAYVAFVLHAAVDWDWEMPAVTLAALLCAGAILAAARRERARAVPEPARWAGVGVLVVLGAFAIVGLVGSIDLRDSQEAARPARAADHARDAKRWAPWSSEPLRLLGEAQLAAGSPRLARSSFRAAIAKDSNDWLLWLDLARATSGDEQKQALRQALRLNPLSPEVALERSELAEGSE